jgi:hypothetical protein
MNLYHHYVYSPTNRPGFHSFKSQRELFQDEVESPTGFSPQNFYLHNWSKLDSYQIKWKQKQRFKVLKKIYPMFKYFDNPSSAYWHSCNTNQTIGPIQRIGCIPTVKMDIFRSWLAASFFFTCYVWVLIPLVLLFSFFRPPLLLLKLAGARADTYGLDGVDNLNMIARDITFPKSPVALLPVADDPSISSFSVSVEAYLEGESGLNADDEHLF